MLIGFGLAFAIGGPFFWPLIDVGKPLGGYGLLKLSEVRADGELLTCEPASELSLAQRYFLF